MKKKFKMSKRITAFLLAVLLIVGSTKWPAGMTACAEEYTATDPDNGGGTEQTMQSGEEENKEEEKKTEATDTKEENEWISESDMDDAAVGGMAGDGAEQGWYQDFVTITAPDGCTIRQTGDSEWKESYTVTVSGTFSYQVKNADGNISEEKTTEVFWIDTDEPSITARIQEADGTDVSGKWTKSKIVELTVTEENIQSVFYEWDGKRVDCTPSDVSGKYLAKFSSDLDESGVAVTFTVLDRAGRTSTADIMVEKIDTAVPKIEVAEVADGGTVYGNESRSFAVTLSDDLSGIDTSTVVVMGDHFTYENQMIFYTPSAEKDSEEALCTLTAYDNAGNFADYHFTVVYDTTSPEIEILGIYLGDTRLERWLGVADFEGMERPVLKFTVNDTYALENEDGVASGVDFISVKAGEDAEEQILEIREDGRYEFALAEENFNGSYVVKAGDRAGNISKKKTLVRADVQAPVISSVEAVGDNNGRMGEDLWYRGGELFLEITAIEEFSSVTAVYATTEEPYNVSSVSDLEENWKAFPAGKEGSYRFAVKDENFRNRTYYVYAVDEAGNIGNRIVAPALNRDSAAPKTDSVLISYEETLPEKQGFLDFITNIFVKQSVKVNLYVEDPVTEGTASGVDLVTVQYHGEEPEVISRTEGLQAVEEIDGSVYNVFEFTLPATGTEEIEDHLRILKIQDRAGNVCVDSTNPIVSENLIVIDSVAPVLHMVDYQSDAVMEKEGTTYCFYNEEARIRLGITERNFDAYTDSEKKERAGRPSYVISRSDQSGTALVPDLVWDFDESGRKATAVGVFPAETGMEQEYGFTLTYQDPSGNLMESSQFREEIADGTYTSKVIAVDTIAPELLSCKMEGESDYEIDGAKIYKNHTVIGSDYDVIVTFEIDDNETYWDPETVCFKIRNLDNLSTPVELTGADLLWEHTEGTRIFKGICGFAGEENTTANYQVEISYADRAGNVMAAGSGLDGGVDGTGTFVSEEFILDHVAPVFTIGYTDPYRTITDSGLDTASWSGSDIRAYYNGSTPLGVTVKIVDLCLAMDMDGAPGGASLSLTVTKDLQPTDRTFDAESVRYENGVYESACTIEGADGEYTFTIACTDAAGNAMVASDDPVTVNTGKVRDGIYSGPALIKDTVAPVLNYTMGEPVNTHGNRKYYNSGFDLTLSITDVNIRHKELTDILAGYCATDSAGADVEGTALDTQITAMKAGEARYSSLTETIWNPVLSLSAEANYTLPIGFEDLAGNAAVIGGVVGGVTEWITIDRSEPEMDEFAYSVGETKNLLFLEVLGWHFSKSRLTITASTKDTTAGIQKIVFTVTDETGQETTIVKQYDPEAEQAAEVTIPLENADFKGTVKAEAVDYSGNSIDQTRGSIVESAGKHVEAGTAKITTLTRPGRTVGGEDYYNTDVRLHLLLEDTYSGLASCRYQAGSGDPQQKNFVHDSDESARAITYQFEQDLTLAASSNNQNDVLVWADYTDNAGHTGHVEQTCHIDVTAPVITVEYDQNDPLGGHFYNRTRTATVTIRERNFDADDVEFIVTNTDGVMPVFGSWSSSGEGDDAEHRCTVIFSADGDYTFTLAFQDLAGNKAEYDRVDEFTIDQTKPEATITYDNNDSRNEYYYAKPRTATVDILEHNFDPSFIRVLTTANETAGPAVSGWSQSGDHHIARVTFDSDADYTFAIEGADQAGNPLDNYDPDRFTVDLTVPELEFFDVEDHSANNGVVAPGIRYSDANYDVDGMEVALTGYNSGVREITGTRFMTGSGIDLKMEDFEHVPSMDDLYTMEATVRDLAGNISSASILFSVNRFGSVYILSEETRDLVCQYYTNKEIPLKVTEINVDTLEFEEITYSRDGDVVTLKEGVDFRLEESGTDETWKSYTYTIAAKNFAEDGAYMVTISSRDRAKNQMNNKMKEEDIEFVIDKTSPSAVVTGVEDGVQYHMASRTVTIDAKDNILLDRVYACVNGGEQIQEFDAETLKNQNGIVTMNIGSSNDWQTIQVISYDAAGNKEETDKIRFLITTSLFWQWYRNTVVFYGSIAALLAAGILLWYVLAGKWRRKKNAG